MEHPVTNMDSSRESPKWGFPLVFCYQCQKRHGPFKWFPDDNTALYRCPKCGKKSEVERSR